MYSPKSLGLRKPLAGFSPYTQIHQPIAAGVELLCQHYRKKYQIDMQLVDLTDQLDHTHCEISRFECLKDNEQLLDVHLGKYRGLILFDGERHAVPIVLTKVDEQLNIIIMDSTSGPCIRSYFKVAALFPEGRIFLNQGTRQADNVSCITDALCILKDALKVDGLLDLITSKITPTPIMPQSTRLKTLPVNKPLNFDLFKMPEVLLKTAQRKLYVDEANADQSLIINEPKGRNLKYYRDKYTVMSGSVDEDGKNISINIYLFFKAEVHKNILDMRRCSRHGNTHPSLPNI